jgi:hypothetical protein
MRRQSAIFLVRLLHDTLAFPRDQVDQLLIACHRRCCVCHRFCGVKIETDHIVTKADGGPDTMDNAIPVCFEYHAEIHSYNDKHPRGRKFRPEGTAWSQRAMARDLSEQAGDFCERESGL